MADLIDFFLDRQFVQAGKRQAEEQADSSFEKQVGITKSTLDLLGRALSLRGIGNAQCAVIGCPGQTDTFPGRRCRRR